MNLKTFCKSDNSTDQYQFSGFENCAVAIYKGLSFHKGIHTEVCRSKSSFIMSTSYFYMA